MWLNSFVTAADPVSPDDLLFVLLVAVPITLWLLSRVRLGSSPDVGSAEGRDFPLAVQRQIVERSGARCEAFIVSTGVLARVRRCGSRRRLEFDHHLPYASGGPATYENGRHLCRAHNRAKSQKMSPDESSYFTTDGIFLEVSPKVYQRTRLVRPAEG
jgi:hypothetical protein